MLAYSRLEILRTLRSVTYLAYHIAFPVMFYLLFTTIFDTKSVGGLDFGTHMMVSMAFFGAFGAGVSGLGARIAMERANKWTDQLAVTPLTSPAYLAAKVFAAALVMIPIVLLVLAIGTVINAQRLAPGTWILVAVVLVVVSLPFAALGVAVGYLFSTEVAQGITLALYLGLALLGGLWIPLAMFPGFLQAIAHWLPTYRAAELGWSISAGAAPNGLGFGILAGWTLLFCVLASWAYRRRA